MSGCLEWCETLKKSGLEAISFVCVCRSSKKWIRKRIELSGLKFNVSEKLILLFHRDEFNWNRSYSSYLKFFFFQKCNANKLTCTNSQLSNWKFHYKCGYNQSWLVLHSARIDKIVQNLRHFFHDFRFNSCNCNGKFNKFNLTNLIIDLAIQIFLIDFFFFFFITAKRPKPLLV